MGETTSLTIHGPKGEDISHQKYVNAGQRPVVQGGIRQPRDGTQSAWQPRSSAVVPGAVVRRVTTLSMRVESWSNRKSARPTSAPLSAYERIVQ